MPRFFRSLLLLLLIITASLLAARLIGERRISAALTTVMTSPDGTLCQQLCLFGIVPGQTSIAEADAILRSHSLTGDATWSDDHTLKLRGPDAYVAFSVTADGLIDSITLADNLQDSGIAIPDSLVDSISLGDIVALLGIPDVGLPGSEYFVMNYPDAGVVAASARPNSFQTHFLPRTNLSLLMLHISRTCSKREGIFGFIVHRWMGFTSFKNYFYDRNLISQDYRVSGVPVPPYAACQA
ncbi:MAG: hypothetical protein KF726_20800 [Anaerolineae bacterium]|nr:hypothetical protein [Anaerolineae bacterium]